MLNAIKSNPRTSIWGISALIAFTLQQNPALVNFLPDQIKGYVLGLAALVCAIGAVLHAQDALTPAEQEVKALKKESEREGLKQEIKEEVKVIAAEKAAELIQSKVPSVIIPEITAETLTVNSIHTDSVQNNSETETKI